MSRLPDIDPQALTGEQREVYDAIVSGPRASVQGPLRIWLQSPRFARKAQDLGAFCRYDSALEPRLSELAIIIVGKYWHAGFEWAVHAPIAEAAGISPAVTEAIRLGQVPPISREDEQIIYDYTQELLSTRRVSDDVHARASGLLGPAGVVDLVGIIGYYTLISMTITAFDVDLPKGAADPFAGLSVQ